MRASAVSQRCIDARIVPAASRIHEMSWPVRRLKNLFHALGRAHEDRACPFLDDGPLNEVWMFHHEIVKFTPLSLSAVWTCRHVVHVGF
jgi:hypothetical protein